MFGPPELMAPVAAAGTVPGWATFGPPEAAPAGMAAWPVSCCGIAVPDGVTIPAWTWVAAFVAETGVPARPGWADWAL